MAREAYRSLYGDLTKLKDDSVLKDPAAGADDDDELFELLLAVTDWVEGYCNRHFYPRVETLLFDGPGFNGPGFSGPGSDGAGSDRLAVPDLIAVTALAETDGAGHSPERLWDIDDYRLLPYNASPLEPWGRPYGAILNSSKGGSRTGRGEGFSTGQAKFRVSGLWGYRCFVEASGATLAAELAPESATMTVSDGSQFRIGQTVLLGPATDGKSAAGAEQALVTAIEGAELSVTRRLNGSAAAAHSSGTSAGILRWPPAVERAALIQAARIWTRAADFEPFYVDADVDTDVRLLLEPYRRVPGA